METSSDKKQMKQNNYNEKDDKIWLQRKLDHIDNFLATDDGPDSNGLEDIYLPHQALPGLSWNNVTTTTQLFTKQIRMPLIINALTGGPPETLKINAALSEVAKEIGVALAVGSQSIAVKHPSLQESFKIVRKINPAGLIIANVAASATPDVALQAVDMLEADALQLHLNPAQELFMEEGERDFRKVAENIASILEISPVEVIVKEVGFGISGETAEILSAGGVSWIDVGGSGGTNFIKIENKRAKKRFLEPPVQWGISTAASLLEVKNAASFVNVIASGGIRTPLDIVKCFALGAKAVAMAGPFLELVTKRGAQELIQFISHLQQDVERLLLLSGVKNPQEMQKIDIVITGKLREWQLQRKF